MASTRWVGSCYNALQSIILDAERFNQLDIMASFMLSFKCHSSYSQGVVLVPKTVLKSEGRALFGQTLGAVAHSLTLSWGAWLFLKFHPLNIFGFVVLPLNSLVDPRGFDCDWFKLLRHQSYRGNSFYCLLKRNISSYYTVIFVCLVPIKAYL